MQPPRPGYMTHKNPCYYYLVLTVRPDKIAETCDASTQYDNSPGSDAAASSVPVAKKESQHQ